MPLSDWFQNTHCAFLSNKNTATPHPSYARILLQFGHNLVVGSNIEQEICHTNTTTKKNTSSASALSSNLDGNFIQIHLTDYQCASIFSSFLFEWWMPPVYMDEWTESVCLFRSLWLVVYSVGVYTNTKLCGFRCVCVCVCMTVSVDFSLFSFYVTIPIRSKICVSNKLEACLLLRMVGLVLWNVCIKTMELWMSKRIYW